MSAYRSILVGTDGSETARTAVDHAIELAQVTRASLMLVSAFEPVGGERVRSQALEAPADAQWLVGPREDVLALLDGVAKLAHDAGVVDVRSFARQGDAADAIIDVAEETGVDLIVVGNKGMTGARRFLLGSVPNKVSHHAPCSVLIVRTT
ncbi:MAG: universal stress protein [Solirubrobacterales bacterium]|nr:universal stress protein [Solirubrobacterales bacterium]